MKMEEFSKWVVNTVGKGQIARNESVFERFVLKTRKNQGLFGKRLISYQQLR